MSDELNDVNRIRLEGIDDFELFLDAARGEPSVDITGSDAEQTSHEVEGSTLVIRGRATGAPKSDRAMQISGSYVTGNTAVPFMSSVKEALHVRYGSLGRPSLRIEVKLAAGTRVVIEGPTGVISTAVPGAPSERDESLDDTLRVKVDELLEKARESRAKGSLSGAIAGHVQETAAKALRNRKKD